jgi:ankyrin repeat protein
MIAVVKGHAGCVQLLLQHAPEKQVAAMDGSQRIPLMLAVEEGHVECARLLLQYSAEQQLAASTWNHMTALALAVREGRTMERRTGCVRLLLSVGAKFDQLHPHILLDQQLAQEALMPERLQEAVIGLALEVVWRRARCPGHCKPSFG